MATRARQIPNSLIAASSVSPSGVGSASASAVVKHLDRASQIQTLCGDSLALVEQLKKESEWEYLAASIEAELEAIRSRGVIAHVVPTYCEAQGENEYAVKPWRDGEGRRLLQRSLQLPSQS
ncbi:SWI/SNF complex subunit SWI3D [Sesbania bispinosa]|nr:SWI/SNF complex subunit SWI3D [Sesbania bispinosa]